MVTTSPIKTLANANMDNIQTQNAPSAAQPNITAQTQAASVKLPTFTPESPDLFFILLEKILQNQGITNPEQIFLCTLMQLPHNVQVQAKTLFLITVQIDYKN